jgi:RNase P/RNase MRP subunit p29
MMASDKQDDGKASRTTRNSFNNQDGGKTLSKNALYAPLVAYEQNEVEPSNYMSTRSSIPKSLQVSSLVGCLQKVSYDYHRKTAKASDPKNNGSRPASVADFDERIRQKAVTLIGGGVNAAVTSKSTMKKITTKSRKRQKREWKDVEPLLLGHDDSKKINSIPFLRQLNASWNEYIAKLLQVNENTDEASSIKSRVVTKRERLELVGAHARVATCCQKKSFIGTSGILLGETKNTWHIARIRQPVIKRDKQQVEGASKDVSEEAADDIGSGQKRDTETITVPKRGSSLVLMIPVVSSIEEDSKGGEIKADDSEEDLIVKSERSFCITLDPNLSSR